MGVSRSVVLIVDDDESLRVLLDSTLSEEGFTVLQAEGTPEALQILHKQTVDVVVIDNLMRDSKGKRCEEGGLDLLGQVVGNWPETGTVVLTALSDLELMKQAAEIGVSSYLSKKALSEDPSLIVRAVKRALEVRMSAEEIAQLEDVGPFALSYSQYSRMNSKQAADVRRDGREKKNEWAREQLAEHEWAWLVVCGDRVVARSADLDELPKPDDTENLGKKYNRVPFLFTRNEYDEETCPDCPWGITVYKEHYPTIPLVIGKDDCTIELVADFDTGSPSVHLNLEDLLQRKVLTIQDVFELLVAGMYYKTRHLGKEFGYYLVELIVQIMTPAGLVGQAMTCHCVEGWKTSPFRKINPKRQALAGRRVLTSLNLRVELDGENLFTRVMQ